LTGSTKDEVRRIPWSVVMQTGLARPDPPHLHPRQILPSRPEDADILRMRLHEAYVGRFLYLSIAAVYRTGVRLGQEAAFLVYW
jgi:hypothetical protein